MRPPRDFRQAASLRFYKSSAWTKLRLRVLQEEPLCRRCERPADVVHHQEEVIQRPDLALVRSNLEPLCHSCHRKHHNGPIGPRV